jgi:hypothetical protein
MLVSPPKPQESIPAQMHFGVAAHRPQSSKNHTNRLTPNKGQFLP